MQDSGGQLVAGWHRIVPVGDSDESLWYLGLSRSAYSQQAASGDDVLHQLFCPVLRASSTSAGPGCLGGRVSSGVLADVSS